jgi:hypothetical protein
LKVNFAFRLFLLERKSLSGVRIGKKLIRL